MTTAEALQKAKGLSRTGEYYVDHSMQGHPNAEIGDMHSYSVKIDGVWAENGKSYEKCFEILELGIGQARIDRVKTLREDLARAEAAIK